MKLSDLYKLKIEEVKKEKIAAKYAIDQEIRTIHKNKAWDLENDASDIAHSLSLFGDISKSEAYDLVGNRKVKSLRLQGFNPWLNGLRLFLIY
ncbi:MULTISPECIES: hypothetical protein [Pectobacterium]|uniref:hypothetical protein n=1 Tax=Pectobacterium TaxID=122277 RepID=UPI00101CCC28|nr:hypothetical protein [Pectobacterium zantedeschiae]RYC47228.1 hypothetical protein DEH81_02265 [Pectobacterium zantedeschiae]